MKKLFILILVSSSLLASAQVPQYNATWYNFRLSIIDSLGVPRDTFPVPNSLKGRPWLGTKGDNTYMWSVTQQKWIPVGSAGSVGVTSVNATGAGPLGVSGVPFTTSGTIALAWNGAGTDYVKANGGTGNFTNDVKAIGDARYAYKLHTHLFSQLNDGVSAVRNLFSARSGLGYNPGTGEFYLLDTLDPANYVTVGTFTDSLDALRALIGTGGGGGGGVTQAQLDDTAAAIRASVGGSTPTLSEVLTAGNVASQNLTITDGEVHVGIDADFGNYKLQVYGDVLMLGHTSGVTYTYGTPGDSAALGAGTIFYDGATHRFRAKHDATYKTLATLDDITGGGSSASPAGNYGNIQINRNGAFSTPASDSLNFIGGLIAKGTMKLPGYTTYQKEEVGTLSGWQPYLATDGTVMSRTAGTTKIVTKTFANDGANISPADGTVLVNATGGATTLVPNYYNTEAGSTGGKITIKKTDASANAVILDFSWGYLCDGATSYSLTTQYQYITIQFTGTSWVVVGGN